MTQRVYVNVVRGCKKHVQVEVPLEPSGFGFWVSKNSEHTFYCPLGQREVKVPLGGPKILSPSPDCKGCEFFRGRTPEGE